MAVINDYIRGQFRENTELDQVGIGGFVTLSRIREKVARTRDMPTTYLEDGSHLNDHIIRNPLTVTIEGVVGDTFTVPSAVAEQLNDASSLVAQITQYAPLRTDTERSSLNSLSADIFTAVSAVDSLIENSQRIAQNVGFVGTGKSNIEKFIDAMEGICSSDSLISIDGPLRTYRDMSVTSLEYDRDNTTESLNFKIEAQQFRFAETAFTEVAAKNPAAGTGGQLESETEKGPQLGEKQDESFLSSILERIL